MSKYLLTFHSPTNHWAFASYRSDRQAEKFSVSSNVSYTFHVLRGWVRVRVAEGRLRAHLQQITRHHLYILLTNDIIAFYGARQEMLAKAI